MPMRIRAMPNAIAPSTPFPASTKHCLTSGDPGTVVGTSLQVCRAAQYWGRVSSVPTVAAEMPNQNAPGWWNVMAPLRRAVLSRIAMRSPLLSDPDEHAYGQDRAEFLPVRPARGKGWRRDRPHTIRVRQRTPDGGTGHLEGVTRRTPSFG